VTGRPPAPVLDAAIRTGLLPCLREDLQLWFSDQPADLELAKSYCRPCPLRTHCLAGAMERREPRGVWGGEVLERGVVIGQKDPRDRPSSSTRRTPCTQR
jgi:WhiB family transcriptional regulator, redox-sensing transcriptional regulator